MFWLAFANSAIAFSARGLRLLENSPEGIFWEWYLPKWGSSVEH